jgi:hypothetical protein
MLRESSQKTQKVHIGRAGPFGALLMTSVICPFFLLSRKLDALRSDKAVINLQMRNAAASYPPAAQL